MTKNVFMKKGHHALFEVDGLNEIQKGVLREMLIASATEMVKRRSFDSIMLSNASNSSVTNVVVNFLMLRSDSL